MPYTPPPGYVNMAQAIQITGLSRNTLNKYAAAGDIPGAIQRRPKAPWYFTEDSLRRLTEWWKSHDEDGAA